MIILIGMVQTDDTMDGGIAAEILWKRLRMSERVENTSSSPSSSMGDPLFIARINNITFTTAIGSGTIRRRKSIGESDAWNSDNKLYEKKVGSRAKNGITSLMMRMMLMMMLLKLLNVGN